MATREELEGRWQHIAGVAQQSEVDVILVYFDEYNMADGYYFSNIWTQFERGFVAISSATAEVCLLVGPETAAFVMTHEADLPSRIVSLFLAWGAGYPNTAWEDAADVLTEMVGQSPRRIGIVGSGSLPVGLYQSLTDITPDIDDLSASVQDMRAVKVGSEIDNTKKAYQMADAGLEAMLEAIAPGMTETALAGVGESAVRAAGAEGYAYSTILTSQARTNSVFGRPTDRQLDDGSMLMIGISPKYKGYCASLGVPITVGEASKERRQYIQDSLAVFRSVQVQLGPGKMSADIYQNSRRELARYGLEKFQIYGAVHSCGLLEAEAPFLSANPNWELMPGMVLLIDLAVFHPDLWGIRWESGYLITDDGAEHLSAYFDKACEVVLQRAARGTL